MNIERFQLDEWMARHEGRERYNLDNSCFYAFSLSELENLIEVDQEEFFRVINNCTLDYGSFATGGDPALLRELKTLYNGLEEEDFFTTYGGSIAIQHVFFSLLNSGDEIIVFVPGYQHLWSLPAAYGVHVKFIHLKKENKYHLDMQEIENSISPKTRMICFSNPCNPTGQVLYEDELTGLIKVARKYGLYIYVDEVYRHLATNGKSVPSIAELYENGIATGNLSKSFSLAGLRLGWIVTPDKKARKQFMIHGSYDMGGCNVLAETIARLALRHKDAIINRNLSMLRANLESLDSWVQRYDSLSYVRPSAGTTALIYYPMKADSFALAEDIFEKTGTLVTPGEIFREPSSIRISYACNHQQLIRGLRAVGDYIEKKN